MLRRTGPLCNTGLFSGLQNSVKALFGALGKDISQVAKTPGLKAKQRSWDVFHKVPTGMSTGVKKAHHTDLLLTASLQFITFTSCNYGMSISLTLFVLLSVSYCLLVLENWVKSDQCGRPVSARIHSTYFFYL